MTMASWLMLGTVFFTGAASPGPSLLVVMRTAFAQGQTAGLAMAVGHALGVGVYAAVVVYGLAGLLTQSTELFEILRWAGAMFLWYLAWLAYRAPTTADLSLTASPLDSSSLLTSSWLGFVTAVLNPKIIFWFVALLAQFLEPSSTVGEKAGIVLMAIVIDGSWYAIVVLGLTRPKVRALFVEHLTWINRVFAVLLILVGARILI